MLSAEEARAQCLAALEEATHSPNQPRAFVGLDGFVDEIIHVVDKREDANHFDRIPSMAEFAARIAEAAGKSTNIELVTQRVKLGGNGPIMANALASLGVNVTYVGALGYPNLHPVFQPLSDRSEVFSIAEAAHTDALEFEDGKIMLGKMTPLNDVTWKTLMERMGRDRLTERIQAAHLVSFLNWTMIPNLSEV